MRVAIINMYVGGMLHYAAGLANTLVRCSAPCDVASFGPSSANPALFDDHIERYSYSLPQSLTRAFFSQSRALLGAAKSLPRDVRAWNPDVVHINSGHITYPLFVGALARDLPVVSSIHDVQPHFGEHRPFERLKLMPVIKHSRALFVHGESLRDAAILKWRLEPNRVHVLPLMVAQQSIDRSAPSSTGKDILMFGRIFAYKGFDVLFKALPAVIQAIPDVRITIAGAGDLSPWHDDLQRFRVNLRVINRFVTEQEIGRLFSETRAVLLPYIEASQSGVAYTAALYGKPVIASRIGAVPEFVKHGETGVLVEPGDHDGLARAIVRLFADEDAMQKMGHSARNHVEAITAPDYIAPLLKQVYHASIENDGVVA